MTTKETVEVLILMHLSMAAQLLLLLTLTILKLWKPYKLKSTKYFF